jgi:hypothetical protein
VVILLWQRHTTIEKTVFAGVIFVQLLVTTLPYFWSWAITPPGYEYSGLLFSPDDQNVHLSWARQTQTGSFFSRNLFTTETQESGARPLFFNALTSLMGVLAWSGAPLIWIYHTLRVLFGALLLLTFYALSTRVTSETRTRFVALVLVAFSGGAQFLSAFFPNRIWMDKPDGNFPMMPEAFTFASSFIFTLNIAAMALLVLSYLCALSAAAESDDTKRKRTTLVGFCAALLLSNIHTYDAIPFIVTLALWTFWQTRATAHANVPRWKSSAIIIVGALLPIFYQLIVFRGSEEFRIKALTPTPAPPILDVLLSYGLLIPLAVAGGVLGWRTFTDWKQRAALRLVILWPVVTLISIYAPVSFARKMIEGAHLPLCLLAAMGVIALLQKLPSRPTRLIVCAGVLLVCCLSSLQFLWWSALQNTRDPQLYNTSRGELMPPFYLTSGDAAALRLLNKNVSPQDKKTRAVLCWPKLGNYVPRETAMFVYAGHWAETLYLEGKNGRTGKLAQVFDFYSGKMSALEAKNWLQKNHIGFIIIGHYERERVGANIPVELRRSLKEIFNENGTAIYAVP